MDVFQGIPSKSVPLCLTSWENQKKSAKTSASLRKKKRVRARRPTNLTQLHQLCQEEWAKTYCGKLVEGYPKRLTQVKQFKGNATKY